jgi:hypothetical protein
MTKQPWEKLVDTVEGHLVGGQLIGRVDNHNVVLGHMQNGVMVLNDTGAGLVDTKDAGERAAAVRNAKGGPVDMSTEDERASLIKRIEAHGQKTPRANITMANLRAQVDILDGRASSPETHVDPEDDIEHIDHDAAERSANAPTEGVARTGSFAGRGPTT